MDENTQKLFIEIHELRTRVVRLETKEEAHSNALSTLIAKLDHLDRVVQRATGALLIGAPILGFVGALIANKLF